MRIIERVGIAAQLERAPTGGEWELEDPGLFGALDLQGHEEIVHCCDAATGLHAIIAIHSTVLGPALGGVRFRPYASEAHALDDVLRLSRAMTYKASLAGLDYGGGKSVIIGEPAHRTEALIRMFARFVESLCGRYITAEDVGITANDIDLMRSETRWVAGTSAALGGLGSPSEATARGVVAAIHAAAEHLGPPRRMEDMHVAVAGVGKVGARLAELLVDEGCRVTVADIDVDATAQVAGRFGLSVVPPDRVHGIDCDLFAPCALGGVLSRETIPELRCAAVVGSANNQLAEPEDATRLADRGIVHLPDYAVNAGGLIQIAAELQGFSRDYVSSLVSGIEATCRALLAEATASGTTPHDAADRLAERRLQEMGSLRALHGWDRSRGAA